MPPPNPIRSVNIQHELSDPARTTAERIIRGMVFAGFIVVLTIEAWLLWSAWQQLL